MPRALALALAAVAALTAAAPAHALEVTLPGSYRSLTLKANAQDTNPIVAKGAYVPLIWFGGPTRLFSMRFEAGGEYLADPRGNPYAYATGQGMINFELPLGPLTPYAGVVGHVSLPFQQPSDVTGIPYGYMPQVGLTLDLGLFALDLHAASYGATYGLSNPQTGPYTASVTDIGGRLYLFF